MRHYHSLLVLAMLLPLQAVIAQFAPAETLFRTPLYSPELRNMADFDGDGHEDLVLRVSGASLAMAWGSNDGYVPDVIFDPSYAYGQVTAVDVDNDGDKDIIGDINNTQGMLYLRNDGDRQFTNVLIDPFAEFIAAADFFGGGETHVVYRIDGNIMMAIIDESGAIVTMSEQFVGLANSPSSASVADFNGDGDLDVILNNNPDAYLINYGESLGLTHPVVDFNLSNELLGDVDQDGDLDYVGTINGTQGPLVVVEQSGGNFTNSVESEPLGFNCNRRALVDLDKDGDLDFVGTTYSGQPVIARNLGSLEFDTPEVIPDIDFLSVNALDHDQDGFVDAIVGSAEQNFLAEVQFDDDAQLQYDYLLGPYPRRFSGLLTLDLDLDGQEEILLSSPDYDSILSLSFDSDQESLGFEPLLENYLDVLELSSMEAMGQSYLLFADESNIYRVALTGGDIDTEAEIVYEGIVPLKDFELYDVDEDGTQDLLLSGGSSNGISWIRGLEDGSFEEENSSTVLFSSVADDFKTGFVSSNIRKDIFVANAGSLKQLVNLGEGQFAEAESLPNPPTYRVSGFRMADVDDDGDDDLVAIASSIYNNQSSKLMIYHTGGSNAWVVLSELAANAKAVEVLDFNQDGKSDLAVLAESTLGPSTLNFYERKDGASYEHFQSLSVVMGVVEDCELQSFDFDQDGDLDVLVKPDDEATLYLLENLSDAPISVEQSSLGFKLDCRFDIEHQRLLIEAEESEQMSLSLVDLQGRPYLTDMPVDRSSIELGRYQLPSGIYYYNLISDRSGCKGSVLIK